MMTTMIQKCFARHCELSQKHRLHCAADGQVALQIPGELFKNPDIIFLNVNMAVMNGWQSLKLLKEDSRYKQIPVIIVSTSSPQRKGDIAADLGAICYFTKPNDFNKLTQVLQLIVANLGAELLDPCKICRALFRRFLLLSHTRIEGVRERNQTDA